MRFETLFCALVILADLTGAARADLLGRPSESPHFTAADTRIIQRNELLRDIIDSDPWLTRRILDLMEQMRSGALREGVDATKNPDLSGAVRTAEGSVEWLELLKRARAKKDAREKDHAVGGARSAEGSVELIEMMKKAKAAKDAGNRP